MATEIEARAEQVIQEIEQRIADAQESGGFGLVSMLKTLSAQGGAESPVVCAGNQHQCQSQFYIPSLDRRFNTVLTGTGDSVIVGNHAGSRALVWSKTELEGTHPELGKLTVRLEPTEVHAGTLTPLAESAPLPALNRNTYRFVFDIEGVGEIVSDRPAIVEAILDQIPPKTTYVFRNGPVEFYRRGDQSKQTVAILEAAVTDVEPE